MNTLTHLKQWIRTRSPWLFTLLKKVRNIPGVKQLNDIASPVTERFNADTEDVVYFNKYMNEVVGFIEKLSGSIKVLDVGCGHGFGTVRIAHIPNVDHVVALDKVPLKDFKFLNDSKIDFNSADIVTFNFLQWAEQFDVVTSTEFIEHISEEQGTVLIRQVYQVLKPGGYFVGSTPLNPTSEPLYTTNPFHIREYQPDFFKQMLLGAGFSEVTLKELGDCFVWLAKK